MSLLAPLLLLAAAASTAPAPSRVCQPFPEVGCWFVPDGITGDPPVLVYIRGHHPLYKADVPPKEYLASARQAFEESRLGPVAEATKHVVLVTYKSGVVVTEAHLEKYRRMTGFTFSKTVVAAHSGAHDGLGKLLDKGLRVDRLVLLDMFYPRSRVLAGKIAARFPEPGRCAGFVTAHNLARYEKVYAPLIGAACPVDSFDDDDHTPAVGRCLASYLAGPNCPTPVSR